MRQRISRLLCACMHRRATRRRKAAAFAEQAAWEAAVAARLRAFALGPKHGEATMEAVSAHTLAISRGAPTCGVAFEPSRPVDATDHSRNT